MEKTKCGCGCNCDYERTTYEKTNDLKCNNARANEYQEYLDSINQPKGYNNMQINLTKEELAVAWINISKISLNQASGMVKKKYEGTPLAELTTKLYRLAVKHGVQNGVPTYKK